MSTVGGQNNPKTGHSLSRNHRLKSKKLFDRIFEHSSSIWAPPIKLVYLPIPYQSLSPLKFAVSTPKRRMKLAVDRNRMKRLVREAYRLNNKPLLDYCNNNQTGFAVLFITQCNSPLTFHQTEEKIILLLRRLIAEHAKNIK